LAVKRAVVLSGGGAKGGYQIGAWQALRELEFFPDIVTGTSVGSFNGALMVSGKYDEALDLWQNIGMECVFAQFAENFEENNSKPEKILRRLTKEALLKGGADFTPLQNRVMDLVNEEAIRASGIEFGMVTTTFPYKKEVKIFADEIPQGRVLDYIMASASAFPLVRSYRIDGLKYIDGGYSDNLPVQMALDRGATEIVAINMGKMPLQKLKENTAKIHYVHNKRPLNEKQFGCMAIFDRDLSRANIRLGYLDTLKTFGLYDGYHFTFEKHEKYRFLESAAFCSLKFESVFGVLPSNNRFEKRGKESVLQLFSQYVTAPFDFNSNALYCAEMAAEIFGVSDLEVYTYEKMCEILVENIKKLLSDDSAEKISEITKQLDAGFSLDLLKTLVKNWDKKLLLGYCTQLFLEDEIKLTDKRRLTVVASIFPEVFCGALFCAAAIMG